MVTPGPKQAAFEQLAREFAAAGDASELEEDQAVTNAMTDSPITAAVALAGQALHPDPGSCAGCTPPFEPQAPADNGE